MKRVALRRAAAVVALGTLALSACGSNDKPAIALDGSARKPSDAGIVTAVSRDHITIDQHRYPVSDRLQAFSTTSLEAVPLLQRKDQYVQVGVRDGEVVWLASIGAVVRDPDPVAYYLGTVRRQAGREVTFRDGTVLQVSADIPKLTAGARVQAEIDAAKDEIRSIVIG
jgi:hypothetical protein